MKQLMKLAAAAALGALASGTIVYAQAGSSQPPKARVLCTAPLQGNRRLC